MDLDPLSVLTGDLALSSKTRAAMLDKLFDDLTRHEIRKVKARFENEHFQFDIVGNLPIEVVVLIFKDLPLAEMLRLQIVSRTWKTLLSSRELHSGVIMTRGLACENPQDTLAFIKKRRRIEEGHFASEIALTPPRNGTARWCMAADYSAGHFAWIDSTKFTLNVLNLWTGKLSHFVTEDRQTFSDTKISNAIVVALARRTCHVWNIRTHEYTNFQLPHSNWKDSFLVHGTNVMFIGRTDYTSGKADLIHWSFGSRIARTISWKNAANMRALVLDPNEEKFTVFHIEPSNMRSDTSLTTSFAPNLEAHMETFALDDRGRGGSFRSISDRIQNIFLRNDWFVRKSHFHCETHPGQINLNVEEEEYCDEPEPDSDAYQWGEIEAYKPLSWGSQRFFIEKNQQLVVHRACLRRVAAHSPKIFKFIYLSPGIIYLAVCQDNWNCNDSKVVILQASKSDNDLVYQYEGHSEVGKGRKADIYGDGDFVVFVKDSKMSIHSFNERTVWNPRQIAWPEKMLN